MADKPTFMETVVSSLGTPKEAFGLDDVLLLIIIVVAAAVYFGIEYGAGRLIARMFNRSKKPMKADEDPPHSQ